MKTVFNNDLTLPYSLRIQQTPEVSVSCPATVISSVNMTKFVSLWYYGKHAKHLKHLDCIGARKICFETQLEFTMTITDRDKYSSKPVLDQRNWQSHIAMGVEDHFKFKEP